MFEREIKTSIYSPDALIFARRKTLNRFFTLARRKSVRRKVVSFKAFYFIFELSIVLSLFRQRRRERAFYFSLIRIMTLDGKLLILNTEIFANSLDF